MTVTTTEELRLLASSDNTNELTRRLARECLANREAQPVALVDRRPSASGSICWHNGGKSLPHGTELYKASPAPVIPDIGSSVVNDAAWKLHDTLTKYGPLNGHQFNHLKSCLYEALKIVMTAPPAQAAPEKN